MQRPTIKHPVVFKFLLLGKATKFATFAQQDEYLKNHYSTHGQKYVVFEFDSIEEQKKYLKIIVNHPSIKRMMRMKLITIE
mgnify:CR=1 FL=1